MYSEEFSRIKALQNAGDLDLALEIADKSLEMCRRRTPYSCGDLLAARAGVYAALGRTADAIADCEMAFDVGTSQIDALSTTGFCHLTLAGSQCEINPSSRKDNFEQAITFFTRYMFFERTRDCLLARAEAFRKTGLIERASEDQRLAEQMPARFRGQQHKKCLKHDSVLSIHRESREQGFTSPDVTSSAISRLIDDSIYPNKETLLPNMAPSGEPSFFAAGEYRFFATCPVCRVVYDIKFAEKEREMWSAWYRNTSEPMASTGFREWLVEYVEAHSENAGDSEADLYCGKDDLRRKSPGFLLNSDQPASDGNYYSINRSRALWDLFQCIPKHGSTSGFAIVTLATGLTVDELYQKLESVDVFVEGHEAIALGLPIHSDKI